MGRRKKKQLDIGHIMSYMEIDVKKIKAFMSSLHGQAAKPVKKSKPSVRKQAVGGVKETNKKPL